MLHVPTAPRGLPARTPRRGRRVRRAYVPLSLLSPRERAFSFPAVEPRTGSGTRSSRRPRALIVEDDSDMRDLYAWCLLASGWSVEALSSGEHAALLAADFAPDVIVMDLCLPVVDGVEVTRQLKAQPSTRDIPVVACTGLGRPEAEAAARQAGCVEFVQKPCTPEDLRHVLTNIVGRAAGGGRGEPHAGTAG